MKSTTPNGGKDEKKFQKCILKFVLRMERIGVLDADVLDSLERFKWTSDCEKMISGLNEKMYENA